MRRLLLIFAVLFVFVSLVACSQRQVAAPPEQPVTKPSESMQQPESVTEKQASSAKEEGVTGSLKELGAKVNDIYFAFDKYDLNDEAMTVLKGVAGIMSKSNAKVLIEGNCDERGTKEYNLALGDKRANAAKQYLISLGIPSARIDTISYGKEKPICSEGTEECWAKNRRDHFVLTEGGR
ncbi:MAG TPA: peptidoglycan-associated lipoprotein Pal [Dissulfurispiraceae bacterium]|nr:peptidoglycan-associated lipoprotein Pal [Dissulfurispiraceae bacterium]